MIRNLFFFYFLPLVISLATQDAHAQTPINGVINKYTPITNFECDSTLLTVENAANFAAGNKVLIIQMQGAVIDTTNSANFGNILDLKGAGNFEFNRIHSISGNKVQLKFNLTKSYQVTGRVQLIFVPEYDNVSVNNLTCLPWDGKKGGVLAIDVAGELTITPTGALNVSEKGFRGGVVVDSQGPFVSENSYFYADDPKASSAKGEGLSIVSLDKSFGRGKAANGGGGGNSINSGGAGGGNGGKGGDGGWQYYNTPSSPTFGTNGVPGILVFTNNDSRISMGGGGRAGHENDLNGTSGGTGGGIIIVKAGTIKTNNRKFIANGADVIQGDPGNDGQGGGGAGGSIFIEANQISGLLSCELKGGRGGDCVFTQVPSQIIGAGGGGGGGKLILSQPFSGINTNLNGGINGIGNQNMANGATPGGSGIIKTGVFLPHDTILTWSSKPIDLEVTEPGCSISDKGSIEVTDEIDVLYSINNGIPQSSGLFPNLSAGTYLVELTNGAGCKKDTLVTITALSITTTLLSKYFCQGDTTIINGIIYTDDAIATDTVTNLTGCDTIQTIILFFGDYVKKSRTRSFCEGSSLILDGITYTTEAIVKDTIYSAFACDTILTTTLLLDPLPTLSRTVTLCPGQSITINGNTYSKAGVAIDTVWAAFQSGCDTIRTTNITFFELQVPFLSADTNICAGEKIRLESKFQNTTWSTGNIGTTIEVTAPGIYIATAFDENNCPVMDTIIVEFCCKDRGIYVPNVFSPDKGENGIFKAFPIEICQKYTLRVWDRWGELIFESMDYEKGWDGTFRGKPAPVGVYIWTIEFDTTHKGRPEILKGSVTLVN